MTFLLVAAIFFGVLTLISLSLEEMVRRRIYKGEPTELHKTLTIAFLSIELVLLGIYLAASFL
jgi:hypothetical protein